MLSPGDGGTLPTAHETTLEEENTHHTNTARATVIARHAPTTHALFRRAAAEEWKRRHLETS